MISELEQELPIVKTKYCSRCKKDLPATFEYFFPSYLTGTDSKRECRGCHALHNKRKQIPGTQALLAEIAQEIDPTMVASYQTLMSVSRRTGLTSTDIGTDIRDRRTPIYKYTSSTRVLLMLRIEDAEAYILSKQMEKHQNLQMDRIPDQNIPAPPPLLISSIGTPDQCGACGVENTNILGDINKTTRERYGYLCARCHKLVNDFRADQSRMSKVLDYLKRTRQ